MLLGVAFVLGACNGPESAPVQPTVAGVTTLPPVVTPAPPSPTTTTTTTTTTPTTTTPTTSTAPGSIPPTPEEALRAQVEGLIAETEAIRGLRFVAKLPVIVLDRIEFAARVDATLAARRDETRLAAETALYRLLGRLDAGDDLGSLQAELQGVAETAWYDVQARALLVAAQPEDLGPLARSEVVHEVVHALTDQHYQWAEAREALMTAGADDRLTAFDALVEGDATYVQTLYIQGLPPEERAEIAAEFFEPSPRAAEVPDWVIDDFAFVFDSGFDFVADIIAGGGSAAVDRAYLEPPVSSEHVAHPERYRRGETPRAVGSLQLTATEYTALTAATLGEWGLRWLIGETRSPGLLTQTVDGWGGDLYQILVTGAGDVALALSYLGDGEPHTIEITEAFLELAEDVLGLGEGVRTNGGVAFERNGRPWVFVDREGNGLVVVIASDPDTGAELAAQLTPP